MEILFYFVNREVTRISLQYSFNDFKIIFRKQTVLFKTKNIFAFAGCVFIVFAVDELHFISFRGVSPNSLPTDRSKLSNGQV